ncbi:hypothetical protein [uncultured Roseobacter sp.]|uniref:hypothetical protein n=1 Tax=uncultured Roseobacter sp. TaxID=114847 RepID=UPI00262419CD|nr:hypothetical protein [uncultured Roseobacter sp.]
MAPETPDRLILSQQQRVSESDVLRLQPADAVHLPENAHSDSENTITRTDDISETEDQETFFSSDADAVSVQATEETETTNDEATARFGVNELTAKIAELETAIAKTSDQWEPDGVSKDDYAGTESEGMAWPDAAELDATGTPIGQEHKADDAEVVPAESLAAKSPVDDQLLDEDALRDLVADIVRSELQGALGERITRNVRKLVRREIHRALAARDLD